MNHIKIEKVSVQRVCLSLGGRLGFGAGWTKTRPEKRSVDGYVSILWAGFRSTCAKYNRTYNQCEQLLEKEPNEVPEIPRTTEPQYPGTIEPNPRESPEPRPSQQPEPEPDESPEP